MREEGKRGDTGGGQRREKVGEKRWERREGGERERERKENGWENLTISDPEIAQRNSVSDPRVVQGIGSILIQKGIGGACSLQKKTKEKKERDLELLRQTTCLS